MKITSVETFRVSLPARRPHPMSFDPRGSLGRYVIVRLRTDEGLEGLGEATVLPTWGGDRMRYYGETPKTTASLIEDLLGPALLGEDPFAVERIHGLMDRTVKGYPYAKAAIDIALYDLMGKALGVPVYQLLGGCLQREVRMAHSLGILKTEECVAEAEEVVAEGIRTIKIKVGLDLRRDVETVRAVRAAIGPDVEITIDANQGYSSPKEAIRAIREMEEHDILFAEQPVEGLEKMAQVAHSVETPIMADESCWTPHDVLEILSRGAADLISLYTTKPGGLWPAKKVAAVAEAGGLYGNVNGSMETGVGNAANLHLAASTPIVREACVFPITTLEGRAQTKVAGVFYLDDIIREPFKYRKGCLLVPERPGLGVELDEEKIERYRTG